MVDFMTYQSNVIREHGSVAVRVFPPAANVLTMFASRISVEVASIFCNSKVDALLTHCQSDRRVYSTAAESSTRNLK